MDGGHAAVGLDAHPGSMGGVSRRPDVREPRGIRIGFGGGPLVAQGRRAGLTFFTDPDRHPVRVSSPSAWTRPTCMLAKDSVAPKVSRILSSCWIATDVACGRALDSNSPWFPNDVSSVPSTLNRVIATLPPFLPAAITLPSD